MTRLLTCREAAVALRLSQRTLERLRVAGGGPAYSKLGRRVLYRDGDLDRWVEDRLRSNTSEATQ
jgi:excisionase family DNA binding protein